MLCAPIKNQALSGYMPYALSAAEVPASCAPGGPLPFPALNQLQLHAPRNHLALPNCPVPPPCQRAGVGGGLIAQQAANASRFH
jgi:hypothetical protein